MDRFDTARALKFGVVSVFGALVVAIVMGEMLLVVGAFVALVVGLRLQRRQEVRQLHGYRGRRRRRRARTRDA